MSRQIFRYTPTSIVYLLVCAVICFSLSVEAADILPKMVKPEVGKQYYTRYNFMYERGTHLTTNYWRGTLVPINSKVKLVSIDDDEMEIEVDGETIEFDNVEKFTRRNISEIASELLSPEPIALNKVPAEFRDDLQAGNLRIGMTKEQVLMTRGYPPRHKTPSTDSNTWTYWSSRFVHLTLVFKDGKLSEGRGIH
jgi:hypothetical protein